MQAALALSKAGFRVALIEKTPMLGGKLLDLDTLYPDGETAAGFLAPICEAVMKDANIGIHFECEAEEITGFVGNFKLRMGKGREFNAGAIVIATGFENYQPKIGEMGFGDPESKVITLPALHAILKKQTGVAHASGLAIDGRAIESIAFIHCVGSRQVEGIDKPEADGKVNDYCSRVCCTSTLHAIRELTTRFSAIRIFDVYRDIRAYGRGHEEIYEKVAQSGTVFFRHEQEYPPVVNSGTVTVRDVLTWNELLEIPADLIVLATGMMPHPIPKLVEQLRLPRGSDRFLLEAHPKLRPVEIANGGIFLAGTCQGPMDVRESSAAARAAASKVSALLGRGRISLDPFVARVNQALCDGCGACLGECSYPGAIALTETCGGQYVTVFGALCKGCGACVAVCPHRAIEVAGWGLDQFDAMVDAIVAEEA
jgi:heterodisulfide reductase subunit A